MDRSTANMNVSSLNFSPATGAASTVVMDCGCGVSKVGYAGNVDPMYIEPTCVANHVDQRIGAKHVMNHRDIGSVDMNFFIGHEAYDHRLSSSFLLTYPIAANYTVDWDDMERFWSRMIFKYCGGFGFN